MKPFFELHQDVNNTIDCFASENNFCYPHFHSNIEILYVLEGEIKITINRESRLLTAGCASVAGSFDIHSYNTPSYSRTIILIIPTDLINSFHILTRSASFACPFMEPGFRDKDMRNAMEQLVSFSDVRDSLIAKGYIYVVLGILTEQLGLSNTVKKESDLVIRDILIYLEEHYLEDLTIEELARIFGYHKDYLSRLFNTSIGVGFSHYMGILRSRHAAMLLRNSDLNLDEIAYQSGFNSTRTFYRAFQSFYNVTPSSYRKANLPENDADRELTGAGFMRSRSRQAELSPAAQDKQS